MLKEQYSAGIIPYRKKDGVIEYLLLHYQKGHWDFPKGKIETGETKEVTALRELKEETGLRAHIKPGFEASFSYFFKVDKDLIHKTVWFFIGEVIGDSSVILSHEHQGFLWLPYDKALKQLTYQNARDVLLKVHGVVS